MATMYKHTRKCISAAEASQHKRKLHGRKTNLDVRTKRNIHRKILNLPKSAGAFTSTKVQLDAGLKDVVSNRTVRRYMNSLGYHYCRSRKKALLTASD